MTSKIDFATLDLQDALDLAILVEEEAGERYRELQGLVGGRYPGDASDVFRTMATAEARHRAQLLERRTRLFADAPRRVDRSWIEEVEAPGLGAPRVFMGPRQAFQVALESEEKAHDFFAEALPHLGDQQVRELFEELKAEEIEHHRRIEKAMATLPPGPDLEEEDADAPGSDPG